MDQTELDLGVKRRFSPRQDIINVILSRGELSKDDIKQIWSLDEDTYAQLKTELADEKIIEPGPRGSGGFAAKFKHRPKAPDETSPAPRILGTAWEQSAADRLAAFIPRRDVLLEQVREAHALEEVINEGKGSQPLGLEREVCRAR
jgi:hypothetical protein